MTDQAASLAPPSDIPTTLAFERTRIAYERTMMAWIRTATSLITFGFSVYKFFEFELKSVPSSTMVLGPRGFGVMLICIGLLSLLLGTVDHRRDMGALRRQYPDMPRSKARLIAVAVGALGLLAMVGAWVRI